MIVDVRAPLLPQTDLLPRSHQLTVSLSRSREFLTASARWSELPEVIEAAETLRIAEHR
jgi:hypothetical protein